MNQFVGVSKKSEFPLTFSSFTVTKGDHGFVPTIQMSKIYVDARHLANVSDTDISSAINH